MRTAPVPQRHVVIVGGGISGLSAAFFLARRVAAEKASLKITLLEASERFGGAIQTLRGNGFHMEAGADAFDGKDPAALELCKSLGIQNELLLCESTLNQVSMSRKRGFPSFDLSLSAPLAILQGAGLSFSARIRLLGEILIPSLRTGPDESIASFVQRRFGRGVLTEWVEPLTRGILMGEAGKLSLREYFSHWQKMEQRHGSIAWAVLNKKEKVRSGNFFTFRGGLDRWVPALLADLPGVEVRSRMRVATLKKDKKWEICFADGSAISADILCVALPAVKAAPLFAEVVPFLAETLAQIRYDSLSVVNMIFKREELPGNFPSSGFIVPSREKKWPFASLKVIGKTEDEKGVRLRAFVSGVFQKELYGQEEGALQREVLQGLAGEWGIQALPSWISVERYPQALVQYETGHGERVAIIEKLLESYPDLFLTGNGFHGFGITECIHHARIMASHIPL